MAYMGRKLKFIKDWQSTGLQYRVLSVGERRQDSILVWMWAPVMDGPIPDQVMKLLDALAEHAGGWIVQGVKPATFVELVMCSCSSLLGIHKFDPSVCSANDNGTPTWPVSR